MRILVYEHLTGGGCAGAPLPLEMAAQGYAMATTALRAFGRLVGCSVVVLHDARLPAGALSADSHIPVGPGQQQERFVQAVREVDGVLVIAPETGGLLADLTATVERQGKTVLGASAAGVSAAGDKLLACTILARAGVRVPRTIKASLDAIPDVVRAQGLPLVIKPRTGAGGEGVSVIRRAGEVDAALRRLRRAASEARTCVVQEYVAGTAASVSLISDGRHARPLTLNRQVIHGGSALTYQGGEVPYDHPQRDAAFAQAAAACAAIPGLRGYVGVDLVLGVDGPIVIEVNPRWTTACVGLQRVLAGSLAQVVVDAVLRGVFPQEVRLKGHVRFDMETLRQEFEAAVGAPPKAPDTAWGGERSGARPHRMGHRRRQHQGSPG